MPLWALIVLVYLGTVIMWFIACLLDRVSWSDFYPSLQAQQRRIAARLALAAPVWPVIVVRGAWRFMRTLVEEARS